MARRLGITLVALAAALSLLLGNAAPSPGAGRVSRAALQPGTLDPTFDGDGKVVTDFGGLEEATGLAIQPDRKIVVAGTTQGPLWTQHPDFVLARYSAEGSLDSHFGSAGKVRTDLGGSDFAAAVAIQADGKIVVAGSAYIPGVTLDADFALARYNADGSLDSTFGATGKVVTNLPGYDWLSGLAIQRDGKIVAVGSTEEASAFTVVRYNVNGSLDSSFGGVGFVTTPFPSGGGHAAAVLIQPDRKIVAAGGSAGGFALARYTPDGGLDAHFDGDGRVEARGPFGGGASSVALQADGKLVVAGDMASITRFNGNGSLDSGFGTDGWVVLFPGPGTSQPVIVLVQPGGKIIVAGTVATQAYDFRLARLDPDGSSDYGGFGDDGTGQVHTDFGSSSMDFPQAAVLQPDNRVVVAGWTRANNESPSDFALARYANDPPCRVPNVRGRKLLAARSAIAKASCSVGKVKRKASKKVKRNRVISQSPTAGTTLPNLGKVNLVVSRGRSKAR